LQHKLLNCFEVTECGFKGATKHTGVVGVPSASTPWNSEGDALLKMYLILVFEDVCHSGVLRRK